MYKIFVFASILSLAACNKQKKSNDESQSDFIDGIFFRNYSSLGAPARFYNDCTKSESVYCYARDANVVGDDDKGNEVLLPESLALKFQKQLNLESVPTSVPFQIKSQRNWAQSYLNNRDDFQEGSENLKILRQLVFENWYISNAGKIYLGKKPLDREKLIDELFSKEKLKNEYVVSLPTHSAQGTTCAVSDPKCVRTNDQDDEIPED